LKTVMATQGILVIVVLGAVGLLGCRLSERRIPRAEQSAQRIPIRLLEPRPPSDALELLAASDPLAFLEMCLQTYREAVFDYRCRLVKRERLTGRLTDEQFIEVRFRENPFSVDLRWVRGARGARRVTYVAGRWRDAGGERVYVEPAGMAVLFAPRGFARRLDDPLVVSESRLPIEEFGFRKAMERIIRYCSQALGHADYQLRNLGLSDVDRRDVFFFERRLPHESEGSRFPDRRLIFAVDRQWLVPVAFWSYADDAGLELLGRYEFTDIEFNVGLTDADF
jgi:hypothetical protein